MENLVDKEAVLLPRVLNISWEKILRTHVDILSFPDDFLIPVPFSSVNTISQSSHQPRDRT